MDPAGHDHRRRITSHRAFSAIELLAVMSVIAILATMTVPPTLTAVSKGAVNRSAESVLRVIEQAQTLAQRGKPAGPLAAVPHYGVVLTAATTNAPARAELVYGDDLGDILLVDGIPAAAVELGRGVTLYTADGTGVAAPLSGRVGWFFAYGSGRPIARPADQTPVPIGTRAKAAEGSDYVSGSGGSWRTFAPPLPAIAASPVCSELSVRSLDDEHRIRIELYAAGLASSREF